MYRSVAFLFFFLTTVCLANHRGATHRPDAPAKPPGPVGPGITRVVKNYGVAVYRNNVYIGCELNEHFCDPVAITELGCDSPPAYDIDDEGRITFRNE